MGFGFFDYDQLRRSWYVFVFQTPMAEFAVGQDDLAFIDRLWADWSPGYDGTGDAARVKEALGTEERLSAAIGYYRAMFGPRRPTIRPRLPPRPPARTPPPQPTLYLHGAADGCMGVEIIGPVTDHLGPGSELVVVEDAGHFLHLERPDDRQRPRPRIPHPVGPGTRRGGGLPWVPGGRHHRRGQPGPRARSATARATRSSTARRPASSVGTHRRRQGWYSVPMIPAWSVSIWRSIDLPAGVRQLGGGHRPTAPPARPGRRCRGPAAPVVRLHRPRSPASADAVERRLVVGAGQADQP